MSHDRWTDPVVTTGVLGWGNRKSGLEAYGAEGRWGGQGVNQSYGDLLGDALKRLGADEGAALVVVAVDRFAGPHAEALAEIVAEAVAGWFRRSAPQHLADYASDDHG